MGFPGRGPAVDTDPVGAFQWAIREMGLALGVDPAVDLGREASGEDEEREEQDLDHAPRIDQATARLNACCGTPEGVPLSRYKLK